MIAISGLWASCKKEATYNPDEHIVYEHWYKLSPRSADTLYSVYFANAFTPGNADGINDVFKPIGNYILGRFAVYNKSGEEVFKTADPNRGWNGCVNSGAIVQMGAYTYQLMVSDINGENYEYKGSVLLYN